VKQSIPHAGFVRKLKEANGKDIWLFGGAELIHACLEHDLVDELMLSVHPILLGAGKPLFGARSTRQHFVLVQSEQYSTGLVQMMYRRSKG
jgi:dihydrofolate reductase